MATFTIFDIGDLKTFIYRRDINIKQLCVIDDNGARVYYVFYKEKWFRRLFKRKDK